MATQRFSRMLADIQRRLKPVLLSLCMALMLLAMGGNQFSVPHSVTHTPSFNEELVRLSVMQAAAYGAPKVGMPGESSAIPGDREIPNENEPDEDPDSDSDSLVEQSPQLSIADATSPAGWGAYSSPLFQNLSRVPLFVLHHSWKSYIA